MTRFNLFPDIEAAEFYVDVTRVTGGVDDFTVTGTEADSDDPSTYTRRFIAAGPYTYRMLARLTGPRADWVNCGQNGCRGTLTDPIVESSEVTGTCGVCGTESTEYGYGY